VLISVVSNYSGKVNRMELDVSSEQVSEFIRLPAFRRTIRSIFPDLSDDERLFLATGVSEEEREVIAKERLQWD